MKPIPASPIPFQEGRHLQLFDDPIHDPYQLREKLAEPCVCSDCGAVYHQGRWQWSVAPEHAAQVRCAACQRIHDHLPAGYVTLEGHFITQHHDEILQLIHHVEENEKREHPLQRIMALEQLPESLLVTTTDIHLARGIGEALHHAYQGDLDFHYNKEEYLLRVRWRRESKH